MRLLSLQERMGDGVQVTGDSPEAMRESIREVFTSAPDGPVRVARGIETMLDDMYYSHVPGMNNGVVQLLERAVRESAKTVVFLVEQRFYEGAWFRTDNALELTGYYLDALELHAQLHSIQA